MLRKPVLLQTKGKVWGLNRAIPKSKGQMNWGLGKLPKEAEKDRKEAELFLLVTLLLETCQLQSENTGQRYCAITSANLDRKWCCWVPRSRGEQEGVKEAPLKKGIIFNSPAWLPTSASPLHPQNYKTQQKLKDHSYSYRGKTKQNFIETQNFLLRKAFFPIVSFCLFVLFFIFGAFIKFLGQDITGKKRGPKSIRISLSVSVPLMVNYSSSFPKINSQ